MTLTSVYIFISITKNKYLTVSNLNNNSSKSSPCCKRILLWMGWCDCCVCCNCDGAVVIGQQDRRKTHQHQCYMKINISQSK